MHKKWRKLVASTLVMTMLISTISYLAPVKTVEALVNNSGNAPYINTWMVAGPSQTPTAEQIYSGISGDELIRPTDGNWAKLAIATATSSYPGNFYPKNAIDGDLSTDWAAITPETDKTPVFTLSWAKPVPVKIIQFYDRHDPSWEDAIHVGNVKEVNCVLKDAEGQVLDNQVVTDIDPTGEKPGVADFGEVISGVSSVELHINYDENDTSKETLNLGFKEVKVLDGENNLPVPENPQKLPVKAVGGSTYGSDVAENALDGNLDTAWKSNTVQGVAWDNFDFTVTLDEISTITELNLTAFERSGSFSFSVPYTFYDASNRKVGEGQISNVTGARDDQKSVSFDVPFYNVKTVKLSFVAPGADSDNDRFGFREVEVIGEAGEVEIPEPEVTPITPVLGETFGESGTAWQYFDDRIYNRNTDDYNDLWGYFNVKQGLETENSYVYAHTYVYSETEQQAYFQFTAMGPHKLWINDQLISESDSIGNVNSKENYKPEITLQAGWNKVLLQIQHNGKPYVGFYARIADADGNQLEGVTCSAIGPTEELQVATQGLQIDKEAFEERNKDVPANEYPDNTLPKAYTEWPYVWNQPTGSAWYGPQASKFQFQASGGEPGYKWSIVQGSLPEGLVLNEDGTIDGYCSKEEGIFTFTVRVEDRTGNTAEKEMEIMVEERPNQWFEEGGASALSHCASAYPAYFDDNYSIDLWAERVKDQGITMISVECKQGPYWWPGPLSEAVAEQHAEEVRWQDDEGNWHIKDMVKPFKEAADRYGLRFGVYYGTNGGWMFGHDGAYDMVDIVDLVERYDPWYIFFDGGPQNSDNVEVRWSAVRSYNDRILIQANDQREASDNDINILEQRYYFDTPYLYGGYWEQNMLPQNKKTVIECWNGPYVRYFHGENAQTGLDWRLATKAFVTSIGQGYVWNWDQETSAVRGYREDYFNYAPDIPDIYNINTLFNQDMITIRNEIIDWFAPEGKPDRRESLFGTSSYSFDYEMLPQYEQEYRSDLAIKYGEGPEWGYVRRRDNTYYMHMVETYTKSNELITRYDQINDKTGFTGQDSIEAGPFDYEVTSVEWLNEGKSLSFESFEKNGKYYATIDTSSVTADPVDTIIKIKTADPERRYTLSGVKTYSSQTNLNQLQLRTEANLNEFASVIVPANVTFTSSNPSVAQVDENGLVTKTGEGKAVIEITAEYEGVTKTDTYPVIADEEGIRPDLELLGVVMFTGEQEVQGAITPFEQPEVTFQGRTTRGGGIDLPFVDAEDITYHYATVDDHARTQEIDASESIFTVEDGKVVFHERVNEKTYLAFWADVKIGDRTFTSNKMFLWVYPDADLSAGIVPEATSNQDFAKFLSDGVAQSEDGYNNEKWTAANEDETPSLTYDLQNYSKLSGVEIYYNGQYWGYENMPDQVKIEVSDDGENWRTVLEETDAPRNRSNYHFDDPETYSFQDAGRFVRVSFPGGAQDEQMDILEIKINGLDYTDVLASMEMTPEIGTDGTTATIQVKAYTGTGEEADLTDASIKITSEDSDVVSVDENGVIHAVRQGKARVTVQLTRGADTLSDYLYLAVDENGMLSAMDFLKEIELTLDNTAINHETPVTPKVSGTMNTGEAANLEGAQIEYIFSDPLLSMNNGKITLDASADPGFSATVKVVVTLDGITLESKEFTLLYADESNLGASAKITVSSTYPAGDFVPENLTDGDKSTNWCCYGQNDGSGNIRPWFRMDLGGEYEITKINLIERGIVEGKIQEGLLEWEGGSMLIQDIQWQGQPDNIITFETPIKTSWLKFTIDPNNTCTAETNHRGLAEFQVFGQPATPTPEPEKYQIYGYTSEFGSVISDKTEATEGEVVTLTVLPEEGYQLVEGSIRMNGKEAELHEEGENRYSFIMPAEDVVVTADYCKLPDKSLLQKTYNYALTLDTEGVVESAVELFEKALANAKTVLDDPNATQEEVNAAWDELLEGIWALGLTQGDKTMLEQLIARADEMVANADKYVDTNWQQLLDALANAKEVMADGDAMEEDVQPAADALLNAIVAQRYKANKSNLEELINKANGIDLSQYSAESVAVFKAALANANLVLADESLSVDEQNVVDSAVKKLDAAIKNLSAAEETPSNPDDPDDGEETPSNPDKGNPDKGEEGTQTPTTGDHSDTAILFTAVFAVMMLAALAIIWRKKQNEM